MRRWVVRSTREGQVRTFQFAAPQPAFKFAEIVYLSGATVGISSVPVRVAA